ncbi:MAG: hypothetical protein NC182_00810 [Prevotella sp.]|nr:hypothetical protein [Staphylococcus sp.]MCM1349724.1 hypothetical protein [Prevotella sp.]
MLRILKHDFKSTYKEFLAMFVGLIVLSILMGVVLLIDVRNTFSIMIMTTLFVFYYFGFFAIGIMWIICVIQSFNKKFFTKEGYLTFTTPISIDSLIISKLIVNFIWFLLTVVAYIISFLILFFAATRGQLFREMFDSIIQMVQLCFDYPAVFITSILKVIIYVVSLMITLFFTLSFLNSGKVRKGRVLLTLLIYGSILSISSLIISVIAIPTVGLAITENSHCAITAGFGWTMPYIGITIPFNNSYSMGVVYFNFVHVLLQIGYIVGMYFLSRKLVVSKLELE